MAKSTQIKAALLTKYFAPKYNPAKSFLSELNLLHATRMTAVGGEVKLNDSNTLVQIGISDFNGTQVPTSANGYIDSVIVRYGKVTLDGGNLPAGTTIGTVGMTHIRKDMPAWLLNSELVLKKQGTEQFRIRISELVIDRDSEKVASLWAKELERALKVEGGQDLEITIASPIGATLNNTLAEYISVNLYGVRFSDRMTA